MQIFAIMCICHEEEGFKPFVSPEILYKLARKLRGWVLNLNNVCMYRNWT